MKTYTYCEVINTGPDEWVAITDISIVCKGGSLMEVLNALGRLGWHMVATVGTTIIKQLYFEKSYEDGNE